MTKNIVLIAVATLIALLAGEVGLRLIGPMFAGQGHTAVVEEKGDPAAYDDAGEYYGFIPTMALMQYYSKAGYRPVPNFSEPGIVANEIGARSTKSLQQINADSNNIVVSGGSTAWGAGVKQEDIFTNVIDAMSVGVGGYLLSNEVSFMRDVVSKHVRVRHWVSFSGWNDVYAAYRGESYYISPDMLNIEGLVYSTTKNPRMFQTEAIAQNKATAFADYRVKIFYFVDRVLARLGLDGGTPSESRATNGVTLVKETEPMSYQRFWEFFSDELIQAASWAKRNQIDFTFVLQPSLYNTRKPLHDEEQAMLDQNTKVYLGLNEHYRKYYPQLSKDIRQLSEQYDFAFLEADDAFEQSTAKDKFFVDHVHFGSKGNRVLGQYLKENLAAFR